MIMQEQDIKANGFSVRGKTWQSFWTAQNLSMILTASEKIEGLECIGIFRFHRSFITLKNKNARENFET